MEKLMKKCLSALYRGVPQNMFNRGISFEVLFWKPPPI